MRKMKFLIGSDIVPTECTEQLFVEGDTEKLFGKVNGLAKDMDRIIINLECALTDYDGAILPFEGGSCVAASNGSLHNYLLEVLHD